MNLFAFIRPQLFRLCSCVVVKQVNLKYSTIMSRRKLAAFDFDHTIVDGNSDTVVRDLLPRDAYPDSVKKLHKKDGWTAYMQGVFEVLHLNGVTQQSIEEAVCGIPPVAGIVPLIKKLTELNFDVIIISDSNTYLINAWLEKHDMKQYIKKVFTNPGEFKGSVLKIEMFHLQYDCKLSTKNLCKGKILEDYIKDAATEDVIYENIVYVGDGSNDFCPILRLNESDLACARENYGCIELIKLSQSGKPVPATGEVHQVKAKVLVWSSGEEIIDMIYKLYA